MKIFRFISVIAIVFILVVVIPSGSRSDTVISYNYPNSSSGITPCIQYDNSTNFNPYWVTTLNSYKDIANMNLMSIWSQDIYVDDYGIVYWVDNYGYVMCEINSQKYPIGSPYPYNFTFAGPVVSMAVINDNYCWYVALLTEWGYVFVYDMYAGAWFNATNVWGLNLQSVWKNDHSPWTSVTSNVLGDYKGYHELFIFTNLNGEVFAFDTTYNNFFYVKDYGGWWNNIYANYNIIATTAYYDEDRSNTGHLFGVSFNGSVFKFNNKGWSSISSTNLKGLIGISIGKSTDLKNTYFKNSYTLFIIQISNGTKLYEYNTTIKNFTSYGDVFASKGTNQALAFDLYDSFYNSRNYWYVLQTNGTIAQSSNGYNATSWSYMNNYLFTYYTSPALNITSTCSMNFYASLYYINSKNPWNMYNFIVNFTGSDGKPEMEFYYNWPKNEFLNPATPAIIQQSSTIMINFTYMPNMAYNSEFYFYVIFYPYNNPNSVILEYILTINIINHYSYIPI